MTRYLGIDFGAKRTGLAVGDSESKLATPAATIDTSGPADEAIKTIIACAEDYRVHAFVVGLPLNMDDSEGPQAKAARAFGQRIADATGKPVHYYDERLSTVEALTLLIPAGLTRKKKKARVDRVAAQVMLQAFLDGNV